MQISFNTEKLKEIAADYDKELPFTYSSTKNTLVELNTTSKPFLEFLQECGDLTISQENKINVFLMGAVSLQTTEVKTPLALFNALSVTNNPLEPTFELKINGKWYPIISTVQKFKTFGGDVIVELFLSGYIGSLNYYKRFYFGNWNFVDDNEDVVKKSIPDLLKEYPVRLTTKENLEKVKAASSKLIQYREQAGKVLDATDSGVYYDQYWHSWDPMKLGTAKSPGLVVIEPDLENPHHDREALQEEINWTLPFIRCFSLEYKKYVYIDLDEVTSHTFNKDGRSKIVLPGNMTKALNGIFNANQDHIFGDLFNGRHGGIVVLANGPSGVGKTLTAEVFSEFQERPLYSLEMSEIGVTLASVEANLQKIFKRAKKWNAVLLFDEADIFLSERVASDLERSAIVGIFLRLLDYYEGTFFLTTNRGEGIDKAFKSRVTLYLDYPELTTEIREKIWSSMLEASGIEVADKTVRDNNKDISLKELAAEKLNGRQIRNQIRLIKLMYPNTTVFYKDIKDSLEFTAK